MSLIYSGLAIAEVIVLVASAAGVLFFVLRAILRSLTRVEDETTRRVPKENLQHLKRAGMGQRG